MHIIFLQLQSISSFNPQIVYQQGSFLINTEQSDSSNTFQNKSKDIALLQIFINNCIYKSYALDCSCLMSDLYTVQKIVGKRKTAKGNLYRVKWKDYSMDDCTWQPEQNLKYVKNLIEDYEEQIARKQQKTKPAIRKQVQQNEKDFYQEVQDEKQPSSEQMQDIKADLDTEQKLQDDELNEIQYPSEASVEEQVPERARKPQNQEKEDNYSQQNRKNYHLEKSKTESRKQQPKKLNINPSNRQHPPAYGEGERINKIYHNAKVNPPNLAKVGPSRKPVIPKILSMSVNPDTKKFQYLCKQEELLVYKDRDFVINNYPQQLIKFYEHKIEFAKIPRISR